ncbi:MAG: HEAT repeat domain-containing protein [Limisphaerales bacterium]
MIIALLWISVPWHRVWHRVKVPILIQCFRHGPEEVRGYAAVFLAHSDGDPKMMVSVLLPGLKDKAENVREMTAIALGNIHQKPERVVPALLASIDAETNATSLVLKYAAGAIGYFGTNAKPWSPILVGMIESNRFGFWSGSARVALYKINPAIGKPLIDEYNAEVSNRQAQAQFEYSEKQRRKTVVPTNQPPTKP